MYPKSDIKYGNCVYCGKFRTITDDHIPPKNIFSKPRRPNNLITVPCCNICNGAASKDDEYFWITLSIREDVSDNIDVKNNKSKIDRALNNPKKIGFRKKIYSSINYSDVFSNSGLFIGQKPTMGVELDRLTKVTKRIIHGLYYYHFKKILNKNYFPIS